MTVAIVCWIFYGLLFGVFCARFVFGLALLLADLLMDRYILSDEMFL